MSPGRRSLPEPEGSFQDLPTYKLDQLSALMTRQGELLYYRLFGLHITECRVLAVVRAHQPMTLGGVCHQLEIDKGHVSRIAVRLVDAGLLERHADPADQRSFYLGTTSEGSRLVARMRAAAIERNRRWMAGFGSEAEARAFVDALDRQAACARQMVADEVKRNKRDRLPAAHRSGAAPVDKSQAVLVYREQLEKMQRQLAELLLR